MKLFIDANIVVTACNKEYPDLPYVMRVLSLVDSGKYKLVTSSVCLAIAFYFATKKYGEIVAKQKISLLLEHIDVVDCGKKETVLAAQNKMIHDFEDGLQYYAAVHSKCSCIITNDTDDFYFSDIEVLGPESFLRKYFG